MKFGFIFGHFSVGQNPLDFNNIWNSPRGLSGSDLGIIRTMQEFVKMGHEVYFFSCYTNNIQPEIWDGIKLYRFEERFKYIDDTFDAAIVWSEFDSLIGCPKGPLRVCCDQLNTFTYCRHNWNEYVDLCTSPSVGHLEHHLPEIPDPSKWHILPLGCDPELYQTDIVKQPGRVIWTSSADRGLHNLLSIWPQIKQAIPEANLKIFYKFAYGDLDKYEEGVYYDSTSGPNIMEMAQRVRYMKEMVERLKPLGVEHVGSVSREIINKELNEAMVLAYPCDTIQYSEGFSVSILEGCAAQACPIITNVDALGGIYKNVVPMVKAPVQKTLQEYTELVIRALKDESWRAEVNQKCLKFAQEHTWNHTAKTLESLIIEYLEKKETIEEVEQPIKAEVISNIKVTSDSKKLVKLNICAGPNVFPFDGWINYDRVGIEQYLEHFDPNKNKILNIEMETGMFPDHQMRLAKYILSGKKIDFRIHDIKEKFTQHNDNSVDLIYCGQAIEHFNPIYETPPFLTECLRILKPGGIIRMTTPDLDLLIRAYLENDLAKFAKEQPPFYQDMDSSGQLAMLMYGTGGPSTSWNNYEGHMFLFTKASMTRLLEKIGFKEIEFYYEPGTSKHVVMAQECVDAGLSHSFIVEAVK